MRNLIFLVLFVVLSTSGMADTIYVPQDYPTIQQAIDAAIDLDEVLVSPGTYDEFLVFEDKAVAVRSTLCDDHSSPSLWNNMIFGNDGGAGNGGGVRCTHSSLPSITFNTIFGNSALRGGGGSSDDYSWPLILNSIIWGNSTSECSQIRIGTDNELSALTISYSDVEGGESMVHLSPGSLLEWGTDMIDDDPVFVDPGMYDLHIQYNSPCRDTGLPGNPSVDFESDQHYTDFVDMGADEFAGHLYYIARASFAAHSRQPKEQVAQRFLNLNRKCFNENEYRIFSSPCEEIGAS